MQDAFESDGLRLACHLARPVSRREGGLPGLVLCHGFPTGARGASTSARTYPELADRIAAEVGWAVLTFNFRGAGASAGDFSLDGWLADLANAVAHLRASVPVSGVWLAGSSTGASLAICHAADDPSIRGVAALAARADFDDWAGHPKRFLEHCRSIGIVRDRDFPPDLDAWGRAFREIRPLAAAERLAPRPLLVVHGSNDELVPATDARALADTHGSAELRIVNGGGHRLRHDPRAIAVLLGWLDHQAISR